MLSNRLTGRSTGQPSLGLILMIKIIDVKNLPCNHVLSKALIKLKKDHERGLLARHVVDKGDTVEIHTPMRKAS